jgi:hypothetical protein
MECEACPYFVQSLSSDLYGAAQEINKEEMNAQAPNVTIPT